MTDATPTDRDVVVEAERAFWLEGGGNADFWASRFAEDGLVALAVGIMDKEQTVAAMGDGQPWRHVDMQDVAVRVLGEDVLLVTYAADAEREDGSTYSAVCSSVHVRRDGDLRLAFHQQSPSFD